MSVFLSSHMSSFVQLSDVRDSLSFPLLEDKQRDIMSDSLTVEPERPEQDDLYSLTFDNSLLLFLFLHN